LVGRVDVELLRRLVALVPHQPLEHFRFQARGVDGGEGPPEIVEPVDVARYAVNPFLGQLKQVSMRRRFSVILLVAEQKNERTSPERIRACRTETRVSKAGVSMLVY
jgi:hypothetical protein